MTNKLTLTDYACVSDESGSSDRAWGFLFDKVLELKAGNKKKAI